MFGSAGFQPACITGRMRAGSPRSQVPGVIITAGRAFEINMRFRRAIPGLLIFICITAAGTLPAKEKEQSQLIAWCYARGGTLEVERKAAGRRTISLSLGRGTLAPVVRTDSKNGKPRALLRIVDLATLTAVEGWADSGNAEIIPLERFPGDEVLQRQLHIEPPGSSRSASAVVARWLVKQGKAGTALVCFVASAGLPLARLAAFEPEGGKYVRAAALEFPFSEMKPGIVYGEVRDLLADGDECLITHEPYREGPMTLGLNMVIRRVQRDSFSTLWKAPLEARNLESFPAEMKILQPPERNVGAPGTVTKADVEFEASGNIYIPVWKALVQFFEAGQDKPLDSVKVTKACTWNGSVFEPVR